jgi:hypothetical protein
MWGSGLGIGGEGGEWWGSVGIGWVSGVTWLGGGGVMVGEGCKVGEEDGGRVGDGC